jgi:hypothetical protein
MARQRQKYQPKRHQHQKERAQRNRSELRTVRFTAEQAQLVDRYLKQNPVFDSFSSLARTAVLGLIGEPAAIQLQPVNVQAEVEPLKQRATRPGRGTGRRGSSSARRRPRFLWDYELGEEEVRGILAEPSLSDTKRWLLERLLSEARFDEVFDFTDLATLTEAFPHLRLSEDVRNRWGYALQRWTRNASPNSV